MHKSFGDAQYQILKDLRYASVFKLSLANTNIIEYLQHFADNGHQQTD